MYDRIRVKYSASFLARSYRASGTIVGLSLIGCRAHVGFLIDPHEPLALLIHVAKNESPLYVARAEVRWLEEQEVGMEFSHIAWEDRQRLSEIIRSVEIGQE